MRLALLSALADPSGTSGENEGDRPAFRRFAGKSILAHQLDCAAQLNCERVLCQVVYAAGPDLTAAMAHAERIGLRFDAVDPSQRLQALVMADDDVIVIEDGVLPDRGLLVEHLDKSAGVLAFPAEPALAMGFERLDSTRAWSGALRTRGDSLARLADLSPDCAVAPSLLRIALQAGLPIKELDAKPLAKGTWQRRIDRQTVAVAEQDWITSQLRLASFAAPGRALMERVGLRWAQDAAGGRWRHIPHGIALATGSMAGLAGVAGWPVTGLGLLLATSCAMTVARIFDRVEGLGAPRRSPGSRFAIAGLARDGLLVALLSIPIKVVPSWLGLMLALALMGLLWLGERICSDAMRALCGDRIVLLAALIPMVYLGWSTYATAGLVIGLLSALLWSTRALHGRLTAN